jgi:hypothetical protein
MNRHIGASALVLAALLAAAFPGSARAVLVDAKGTGITYSLTEATTNNPAIDQFVLTITGINAATDTEGGRSGVNAIAFNPPTNFAGAQMVIPASGFTTFSGGLNSKGCDGSGNFFCFDNTAIPPTPGTAFASTWQPPRRPTSRPTTRRSKSTGSAARRTMT